MTTLEVREINDQIINLDAKNAMHWLPNMKKKIIVILKKKKVNLVLKLEGEGVGVPRRKLRRYNYMIIEFVDKVRWKMQGFDIYVLLLSVVFLFIYLF